MPKMNRAHKKVMLDHLGIPLRDLPTKTAEIDALLDAFMNSDVDKYRSIYNVVVNKILPSGATTEEKGFKEVGLLISEYLEPMKVEYLRDNKFAKTELAKSLDKMLGMLQENIDSMLDIMESTVKKDAEAAIKEAAKKYERIEIKVGNSKPKKIDGVVPEEFEKIIQLAANRVNIMMVGPSGCGKTFLASKVAEVLDLDFSSQSCSAGMSESQLTGWLLPVGETANFVYVSSEFVRIYENGGVFLIDEIDASDPNVLIFINSALAGDEFFLPQRFNNPKVKRHPDFVAIAAANTYGGGANSTYTARNSLDGATLDRFRMGMISLDYSPIVEEKLIDAKILEFGRAMRRIIADAKLRKIMSTRFLEDATKMKLNCEWSIKDIYDSYIEDWSREEKAASGVESIILPFLIESFEVVEVFGAQGI